MAPDLLIGDEVAFDRDLHAYLDTDKTRCMSVTQALNISGLVDYSHVPVPVLVHARRRGTLVHQACAIVDRGEALSDFDIPGEIDPYIDAWLAFRKELKFSPDPDWVERPMIVGLFGHRVGMTPDAVGLIDGVPTVIERKSTAAAHPAWAIQTAGYSLGLQAAGLQIRQRIAVQLLPTGRYKLHPHEDGGDYDAFGDFYRAAAWKLKHRLAVLD